MNLEHIYNLIPSKHEGVYGFFTKKTDNEIYFRNIFTKSLLNSEISRINAESLFDATVNYFNNLHNSYRISIQRNECSFCIFFPCRILTFVLAVTHFSAAI